MGDFSSFINAIPVVGNFSRLVQGDFSPLNLLGLGAAAVPFLAPEAGALSGLASEGAGAGGFSAADALAAGSDLSAFGGAVPAELSAASAVGPDLAAFGGSIPAELSAAQAVGPDLSASAVGPDLSAFGGTTPPEQLSPDLSAFGGPGPAVETNLNSPALSAPGSNPALDSLITGGTPQTTAPGGPQLATTPPEGGASAHSFAGAADTADPTGGILDFLKRNSLLTTLLGTAGGLGLQALKGGTPIPAALKTGVQQSANRNTEAANAALDTGKALSSSLATGQLPPGAEALVQNQLHDEQTAIKSYYANLGMSGSSAEQEDLSQAEARANAMRFQLAQQTTQTGLQALVDSGQLTQEEANDLLQIANAKIGSDDELSRALAAATSSLAFGAGLSAA